MRRHASPLPLCPGGAAPLRIMSKLCYAFPLHCISKPFRCLGVPCASSRRPGLSLPVIAFALPDNAMPRQCWALLNRAVPLRGFALPLRSVAVLGYASAVLVHALLRLGAVMRFSAVPLPSYAELNATAPQRRLPCQTVPFRCVAFHCLSFPSLGSSSPSPYPTHPNRTFRSHSAVPSPCYSMQSLRSSDHLTAYATLAKRCLSRFPPR